ncbi:hypothetical protein [Peribacillus frigoritolerans]|nr:hypothetical protein [Peribacillus frigoritolerans]
MGYLVPSKQLLFWDFVTNPGGATTKAVALKGRYEGKSISVNA